MKAIAVIPGKPSTLHLRDVPKPAVTAIADGRGVLVKILRVGVDGTDEESMPLNMVARARGSQFIGSY